MDTYGIQYLKDMGWENCGTQKEQIGLLKTRADFYEQEIKELYSRLTKLMSMLSDKEK